MVPLVFLRISLRREVVTTMCSYYSPIKQPVKFSLQNSIVSAAIYSLKWRSFVYLVLPLLVDHYVAGTVFILVSTPTDVELQYKYQVSTMS